MTTYIKRLWICLFLLFISVEAVQFVRENNHDIVKRADNNDNNDNDNQKTTDIPLVSQGDEILPSSSAQNMPVVSQFVSGDDKKTTSKHTGKSSSPTGKQTAKSSSSPTGKHTGKSSSTKHTGKTTSTHKSRSRTSSHHTTKTTPTSIDPRLPPGGITMVSPNPTSVTTTYVKVGQTASFEWSYTSLLITPDALDVLAFCSVNSQTYTVTKNLPAENTQLVWDTKEWAANNTIDLLTSQYTLYIFDAKSNTTAVPQAGLLQTFEYPFGMYLPQSYTPWAGDKSYVNMAAILEPTVAKWLVALGVIASYTAFHIIMS